MNLQNPKRDHKQENFISIRQNGFISLTMGKSHPYLLQGFLYQCRNTKDETIAIIKKRYLQIFG
ncbi:hypothetical protein [Candidatus Phytoplasma tritici]|uniref:hypothetical protein n=1 Tax=Candidatus Phytoplasma tritici TaxID=321961 RepID=UPI0003FF1264|nr:hypothetical protein [Candidatus Phytoplasma tritici]